MTTDDDDLAPGMIFGRYQLVELLGAGGMSLVWKAMHLGLRKSVVIKVLRRDMARDAQIRLRFLREGEAASRIRHPHVIEIHDVGMRADLPYLVMEFLEGEDLGARLFRDRAMPAREVADLLVPVCAAVSAAHEEGVVHRDLKPANIFLAHARDGTVHPIVLDFGISRVVDDTSGRIRTQTAVILGTPRYMSPEQARGERIIDDRSDQYSLGVILYECATGRAPIADAAPYAMLDRVVRARYARPRALRPELPEALETVILRAMALHAERRYPSVRALGAALLPFASERTRVLWSTSFEVAVMAPSHPARVAPEVPAVLDEHLPAFVSREGSGDTLVDESPEREAPTVRIRRPRWPGIAVGAAIGVAASVIAWCLGRM